MLIVLSGTCRHIICSQSVPRRQFQRSVEGWLLFCLANTVLWLKDSWSGIMCSSSCGHPNFVASIAETTPNFYNTISARVCQGSLFLMCGRPRLFVTWPGATHSLQELAFNERPHSPPSARFVSSSALLAGRFNQSRKMIESSGIEMPVAYSSTAMAPCLVQRRWGTSASCCPYPHPMKIDRLLRTGIHI